MLRSAYAPELLLESDAADIAIRWQDFESEIAVEFPYKSIVVEVRIRRRGGIPLFEIAPLTDCQKDILIALRDAHPERLTRPKIFAALEDAEKIHGESTIVLALAALVRMELIDPSPRGTRRGYAITERGLSLAAQWTKNG